MKTVISLALKSIWNRRVTALLSILSVALSVLLLLGVNRLSDGTRASFQSTISGTDLIVGARGSQAQLLLYSVFHIGDATADMSFESFQMLAAMEGVDWAVPLALGDSHRGYRVVGTTTDYFSRYRYGGGREIAFRQGRAFDKLFDAVIGAEVARRLGYEIGEQIILTHGTGAAAIHEHTSMPFTVTGILAPTGTPVDRAVYASLEAITAIHIGWQDGMMPRPGTAPTADEIDPDAIAPSRVTAVLVGLTSRLGIFTVQRTLNEYEAEPLMAILPGVVIVEIWRLLSVAENALSIIAVFVVATGLLGMVAVILTALSQRRREIAILRSLGASPPLIFALFALDALLLAVIGCLLGVVALFALSVGAGGYLTAEFGLFLPLSLLAPGDVTILAVILGAAIVLGLIPALLAYRRALADGLSMRV